MSDEVNEIKSKIDIASFIGEYIDIKKSGRNFKANCPFHGEKTPSFMISQELQMYKCFGCGESGDVFTFLEKYEGMDFPEALKFLAQRTGVKLSPLNIKTAGIKSKLLEINSWALKFYSYMLFDHKLGQNALLYAQKERKLTRETLEKFSIGYAPEDSNYLLNFLIKKKKFQISDLEMAGLIYKGRSGSIDRFRGRLIFPLKDHMGNVVGFAGRVLPGAVKDTAKYINSPETEIYHKSQILFGLDATKNEIKKRKNCIVVEGELDLISCWQAGVRNIVAIKGSAFTQNQAKLLSRFTDTVTLFLDSDFAGDSAARKGISIAELEGLSVYVAHIPTEKMKEYKDPDDLAKGNRDLLLTILNKPKGAWDFVFDTIFSKYDINSGIDKGRLSKEIPIALSEISDTIVRTHYVSRIAKKLGIPESELEKTVSNKVKGVDANPTIISINTKLPEKTRKELLEEQLLYTLISSTPDKLKDKSIIENLSNQFVLQIIDEISKYKSKKFVLSEFSENLPENLKDKFNSLILASAGTFDDSSNEKYIEEIVKEIKKINLRFKREEITGKIRMYEETNDKVSLRKAEKDYLTLTKKLSELD